DPVALAVAEGLPAVARLDRVIEGSERGNAPERTAVENGHLVAATASSATLSSSAAMAADEVLGDTLVLVPATSTNGADGVEVAALGGATALAAVEGGGAFTAAPTAPTSSLGPLGDTTTQSPLGNGSANGHGTGNGAIVMDPAIAAGVPPDATQRFSPYPRDGAHNGRIRGPRLFLVGIALLAALALLAYMLSTVLLSDSVSAVGVAAPADVAQLNVANTGVVTDMLAKVGEVVPAGKVLATQSNAAQAAQLAGDQARLTSDQAAVQALTQPAQSAALINAQAQVSSATVDVQNAQSKLSQTTAAQQAAVAAAQSKVQSEQSLYNADNQQDQAMIPACTSPNPPADCGNAEHQVQVDQNNLSQAQSAYQLALVTQSTTEGAAQTGVNQANASLAAAKAAVTAATIPPTSQDMQTAAAKVQLDQAAVSKDREALDQTELRAPFRGVVAAVGGTSGDVATPNGVRQGSVPSPVGGTQGSTGINIVTPSSPGAAASGQQQLTSLYTINSLSTEIVAQVAEGSISRVSVGEHATVTVPSAPGSNSFTATVISISPTPTLVSGQPYYLVKLRPAKSADAIFARLPHTGAGNGSKGGLISDFTVNVKF
ncbi:MAG TPA: hypothetical protein VHZ05_09530, partial [Acidimicrobiales bacterium]|nr:hypothetical protein [Acidimicrobiales bacterium]